jgi:hypothetical protein
MSTQEFFMRLFLVLLSLFVLQPTVKAADFDDKTLIELEEIGLEGNQNSNQDGLELQDALEVLNYARWRIYFCDILQCCLGGFCGTLFIPGLVPGAMWASSGGNGDPIDQINIAGYYALSVPAFFLVCSIFSPLLYALLLLPVAYHNAPIDALYDRLDQNEEHRWRLLREDEIRDLAPYLLASGSKRLQELSFVQASILGIVDKDKLSKLMDEGKLSPDTTKYLRHYFMLLASDLRGLVSYLNDSEIQELFKGHPPLFYATVSALKESTWNNNEVQNACQSCLSSISKHASGVNIQNDLLAKIRAGHQPNIVPAPEVANDKLVRLVTNTCSTMVSAAKLKQLSGHFANQAEIPETRNRIWFDNEDYSEAPMILAIMAKEHRFPKIKKSIILPLLLLAKKYEIASLTNTCDDFINERKLIKMATATWLKDQPIKPNSAYYNKVEFCKTFSLDDSKQTYLQGLIKKLNSFREDIKFYEKLAKLDSETQEIIFKGTEIDEFYSNLRMKDKLLTFANLAINSQLEPFKQIIREFSEQNNYVTPAAWIVMPRGLLAKNS